MVKTPFYTPLVKFQSPYNEEVANRDLIDYEDFYGFQSPYNEEVAIYLRMLYT